jgi:effector-binding domain-containing protein
MSLISLPAVVGRKATNYVAVARSVRIPFQKDIDRAMPMVADWLGAQGVDRLGSAIFRYNVIAMPELEMEFGFVPPRRKLKSDGEIVAGVLPEGRYATITHFGHYRHLVQATGTLINWARGMGIRFDVVESQAGDRFASRFELYSNGPMDEPDPDKWETQIFIKVRE